MGELVGHRVTETGKRTERKREINRLRKREIVQQICKAS